MRKEKHKASQQDERRYSKWFHHKFSLHFCDRIFTVLVCRGGEERWFLGGVGAVVEGPRLD